MKKQAILAVILLLLSLPLSAQEKWAVEIRPQVNFPTQQPELFDFQTGYGFDVLLSYKFMPHLSAYAGWGWNTFGIDEETKPGDFEVDETGYSLGLRFIRPISGRMSYLAGVGGIYKHLEAEDATGEITGDSGHELGWEIQGGLIFDLGGGFDLRPQLTYRSLSATADLGPVETDLDLQYISIGLALAKSF